VAEWLKAAAC